MRALAVLALVALPMLAQERAIDTSRSTITIHVGKAGLLSAAGHEHWIEAPIAFGTVVESGAPHVEFRVEAAKMKVRSDPKIDAQTEATIQKDMQEMTLESAKYPAIEFRSTHAEKAGAAQWKVDGALSLHGVSKPVGVAVAESGGAYTGHVVLKQTTFGIKPISVAGGTIRVKNEIEIDFRIFVR